MNVARVSRVFHGFSRGFMGVPGGKAFRGISGDFKGISGGF